MGRAARWFKGLFGMKKVKERDNRGSGGDSGAGGDAGAQISRNVLPAADHFWMGKYMSETEKEQNKHAIAVAAATAAAADAAVAAAQAAVAVVRLTSNGRAGRFYGGSGATAAAGSTGKEMEMWAAAKIQTVFRGFLARKALRALKGLVKIQALVRGYLVRKRAAATLHSMQALIRAQTAVRSQRITRSLNRDFCMFQPRQSLERFDDSRSEMHSKRISGTVEQSNNNSYDENSPKIVEIDTYKTRSRSKRMNIAMSECGDDLLYQGNYAKDFEWCFPVEKCKFSTAQSTPRFSYPVAAAAAAAANFYGMPPSPAKSVCGDVCFRPNYNGSGFTPSYMANTKSFKAKLRSQSAPRQRPAERKRLSLDEIMAARNSISSVRMMQQQPQHHHQHQRSSCSYDRQFEDALHFGFFN